MWRSILQNLMSIEVKDASYSSTIDFFWNTHSLNRLCTLTSLAAAISFFPFFLSFTYQYEIRTHILSFTKATCNPNQNEETAPIVMTIFLYRSIHFVWPYYKHIWQKKDVSKYVNIFLLVFLALNASGSPRPIQWWISSSWLYSKVSSISTLHVSSIISWMVFIIFF